MIKNKEKGWREQAKNSQKIFCLLFENWSYYSVNTEEIILHVKFTYSTEKIKIRNVKLNSNSNYFFETFIY